MTITDFLLARIAEDEARARDVRDPQLRHIVWSIEAGTTVEDHVLAECEAKRRIMEAVSGWQHETVEDCWYSCAATYGTEVEDACCNDSAGTECDCGLDYRKAQILGPLALPYADHADYREEWQQ